MNDKVLKPSAKPQAAYAASLDDVAAAALRIAPYAHRTPVMTCATLHAMAGRRLYFKCEHLQKVGAFKFRGACNAVMKLSETIAMRGVVTHSSGNHAQALALAAKLRGIAAHIVMPRTASKIKREAVAGYGGRVILCEPDSASREGMAAQVQQETGATLIHPYNHPDIIAGQGTAAMELIEEVPHLDAIITPVGGGGLLSGTCIAAKGLAPRVRVFAGEPLNADDAARSLAEGTIVPQPSPPRTIADGLLTSLGPLTFAIIRDHVERIVTVTEEEIIAAMRLLWLRAKLLVEPSSAVALAAVLGCEMKAIEGIKHLGIILSGGNVDVDHLPW
ncbi:MAG: pyridoxal-phosphate dependent enzyme [Phycisphaeraceae bacterium]